MGSSRVSGFAPCTASVCDPRSDQCAIDTGCATGAQHRGASTAGRARDGTKVTVRRRRSRKGTENRPNTVEHPGFQRLGPKRATSVGRFTSVVDGMRSRMNLSTTAQRAPAMLPTSRSLMAGHWQPEPTSRKLCADEGLELCLSCSNARPLEILVVERLKLVQLGGGQLCYVAQQFGEGAARLCGRVLPDIRALLSLERLQVVRHKGRGTAVMVNM